MEINLAIADIEESVKTGEKAQLEIEKLASKALGINLVPLPDYSDIDYLGLSGNKPFFLEIKARTKFYEEAISPKRKYEVAVFNKQHLKLNTYAIFTFKDKPHSLFVYDLTLPTRSGQITRKDRNITDDYMYYKPVKVVQC